MAGIDSLGGYERQYLVIPDVQRLAALNITIQDLATTLERSNTSIGAGTVDYNGAGLFVRSDARVGSSDELARTVIATRDGVPILLNQVAEVRPGQGIRTGSASENGHEVVVGTAIMRIGENSRTVASAVGERLKMIGRSLPADIIVKPVLDRTVLVNSTIATVARNLAEGAMLVIVVLFLLLGNFRAALIAALVIPITMLLTATGMLRAGVSANLMSLGALDFGLIVDGAIIIVENALRRLGERQHETEGELPISERLAIVGASRARDDQAVSLRPGHHHPGLRAAAHFLGRRGQDVRADGVDRYHRTRLRLRSLAHLRAGGHRRLPRRQDRREGERNRRCG